MDMAPRALAHITMAQPHPSHAPLLRPTLLPGAQLFLLAPLFIPFSLLSQLLYFLLLFASLAPHADLRLRVTSLERTVTWVGFQ